MKTQESIDAILAKYNRLLARFRDLEQQTTEKQEKWGELEREFKINETLTRELCELILAKDPGEMRLGTEYSWGKLPTRDIINRSKNVFATYNEKRTELLRDIQRQSEERRLMIESLQAQVEQDAHAMEQLKQLHASSSSDASPELTADALTGEIREPDKPAVDPKTMRRVAYATQQAAERGDIEVVGFEDDEEVHSGSAPEGRPTITQEDIKRGQNRKPVATRMNIWEEKKDVSHADIEQQADMAEQSVAVALERSGASMTPSSKKSNIVSAHKSNAEKQFMSVDISEIAQRMTDRHWAVMDIIGSTGICEGSDIVEAAIQILNTSEEEKVTNNGMRYILMNLVDFGCLVRDTSVTHPLKTRFATYSLSSIGQNLYSTHFGKTPVVSERDILIAEHDNLEHAFGIKALKAILETNSFYSNVSMSRMDNTIKLKDGTSYIPDIIAQAKIRGKPIRIYMEYERGTHHQADFSIKLNKAIKVTNRLDIVCPNNMVAANLRDKVAAWVESRGGSQNLSRVKIRITTLRRISGATNINNDDNWVYVFNLANGDTPIERI